MCRNIGRCNLAGTSVPLAWRAAGVARPDYCLASQRARDFAVGIAVEVQQREVSYAEASIGIMTPDIAKALESAPPSAMIPSEAIQPRSSDVAFWPKLILCRVRES